MITKEIRKLDTEAVKLALYYKRLGDFRDDIIGVEVLAKDGRVLDWMGETEPSSDLKCDTTVEVDRVL